MRWIAFLVLLLAAPPAKKHWAKVGVGIRVPSTWEVVEDKGDAFVVKGPRLGKGHPRLALQRAGPANVDLDAVAKKLVAEVTKRPSWAVTAKSAKRVGSWPALRVGFRFEEGGTPGRARATIVMLGADYYVLEMSAPASHFPGSVFDRIEQSLEVKWDTHDVAGLAVAAPAAWQAKKEEASVRLLGPRGLQLAVERAPARPTEGLRSGPKVEFLGAKRGTFIIEREREGDGAQQRMLIMQEGTWAAVAIMPIAAWDDVFPLVEAVLARAKPVAQDD
jgi:hypothetical protein